MMGRLSDPVSLAVVSLPAVDWVPSSGACADIATTNTFTSLATTPASGENIGGGFDGVIDAYGTTKPCRSLGTYGSILCHGGGHGDGNWNGLYRYDLATKTFSTIIVAAGLNTVGRRLYRGTSNNEFGNSDGEYWSDAAGTQTYFGTTGISEPVARHTYNTPIWLPQGTIGSDPLGYFVLPGGKALSGSGGLSTDRVHYASLTTAQASGTTNPRANVWGRGPTMTRNPGEASSLYDSSRNRIVVFYSPGSTRSRVVLFYNPTTGVTSESLVTDSDSNGLRNKDGSSFYWAAQDLYIHVGGASAPSSGFLRVIDPDTLVTYPVNTSPTFTRGTLGAWEWNETWQQLVYFDSGTSGNRTFYILTPPSDPTSGAAWTVFTQTITGDQPTIDDSHAGYGKLQWFSSVSCYLWMPLGNTGPQAINIPRFT